MTRKMAVWLDHKRALVVTGSERKISSVSVDFTEEPRSRPGDDLRSTAVGATHGIDPDQRRDARHAQHLQARKPLAAIPVAPETVDRMTDAQVGARTRQVFGEPARRSAPA